jgi:glycosyltransferase involved in cell wall biosynthesis
VHCFDTPTDIFALPVARMAGVPAVIGSRLWSMESIPAKDRHLARFSERWAHRIVVNSRYVGSLLEREGISKNRIYLSYNGVDTGIFRPQDRLKENAELVIGSVCALRSEKRLDLLIEAFAHVSKTRPHLRLLIVGSGPMEQVWKQRAQDLQIQAKSHFEPTKAAVAEWMRKMDVFVLPSDTESFPNALLEAMACGCSVIGSNVGGIPEMIDPGNAGQVFEPGKVADLIQKLENVVDDPQSRVTWARAAAKRAEQEFSMQQATQRMEHLYTSLLRFDSPATASVVRRVGEEKQSILEKQ